MKGDAPFFVHVRASALRGSIRDVTSRTTATRPLLASVVFVAVAACTTRAMPTSRGTADVGRVESRAGAAAPRAEAEIDRLVEAVLTRRDLASMRTTPLPELGEHIYELVYEPKIPPKPRTVSEDALRGGLLAYEPARVFDEWIWRFGREGSADGELRRIYMNVMPDAAVAVADRIAVGMNAFSKRWGFKLPKTLAGFDRSSSGVLYVNTLDYTRAKDVVVAVVAEGPDAFANEITPLTKPIAKGAGAAHEPSPEHAPRLRTAQSFGSARCDMIAEAIAAAPPEASPAELKRLVRERFRRYGVDPERPWLDDGAAVDDL